MKLERFNTIPWKVLLIGLAIRLLCMPFTANSDLLYTYWDAHQIAYHHQQVGFQFVSNYLHAGYLWLITSLLPPIDTIWVHLVENPELNPYLGLQVTSLQGWFDFINQSHVYRTLFLLKLPYLLFDLGCAYLLYKMGSDRLSSRRIFTFWWLNPIVIFAVYIFGRHEVIALFLIVLSLFLIKQEKYILGILTLVLAMAIRYYAIFLLPFFIFSIYPTWRKRLILLFAGILFLLAINLLGLVLFGFIDIGSLVNLPHSNYLLSLKLPIAPWDNLYIFPMVYILLLLHRIYNLECNQDSLVRYSLVVLLILFATAYSGQSPHYWTWFLPLLAVVIAEDRDLIPLHIAQIICLVGYSMLGGRSTAGYLFAPISPEFFWSLPSPVEILQRFGSPEAVISLARTAFSAVSLWMSFMVFHRIKTTYLFDIKQDRAV